MASGLQLPIAPDKRGRSVIITGSDQLKKIIDLNLSDLENENPWQQWRGASHGEPGIDEAIVFAISTAALQGHIVRNIKEVFRRMEAQGRARLESGYPKMTTNSELMELEAEIKYWDLEIDEPVEFTKKYKLGSAV